MTCTASRVPFCRVTVWPEKGNNLNTITPPTLSGMTMDQHYDELYKGADVLVDLQFASLLLINPYSFCVGK